MSLNSGMFSSNDSTWETPQWFFDKLNNEFNFTLDVCASIDNAKCSRFFTEMDNGLIQDWGRDTCFMNPPYSREIPKWIKKAYEEALRSATVVCLIPARTDTRYWHDYVMNADEIWFVKGRLKFGGAENSAPFPSAVIVFRPEPWYNFPDDPDTCPRIASY